MPLLSVKREPKAINFQVSLLGRSCRSLTSAILMALDVRVLPATLEGKVVLAKAMHVVAGARRRAHGLARYVALERVARVVAHFARIIVIA